MSAFQLPAIEAIVKSPPIAHDQKHSPILVLVLCPTRELASQVAAEAGKLLRYHPSIGAQVVIGGIKIAQEQKQMRKNSFQVSSFLLQEAFLSAIHPQLLDLMS